MMISRVITRGAVFGVASLLSALPSVPLAAESASATADGSLEEVVVTAEKVAKDLQKTAISIQVYDGEKMVQQAKKRLDDITRGMVGIQSQDSQYGGAVAMRGVDTGSAPGGPGQTSGNTVALLIDGVYQTRSEVIRGATLDVERVEVMRGTQSSTLGANALAGAISLVSNKPVFEYQGSASVGVGNYDLRTLEGVINLPFSSNQAIRAAFSSERRDGYLSSGAGDSDLRNARVRYRWQINDAVNLMLNVESQTIGGNGVTQGTLLYSGNWEGYNPARAIGSGTCGGAGQPTCYLTVMGYPPLYGAVAGATIHDRSNPWDDGYPEDRWPVKPLRNTPIKTYSAELDWNTGLGTLTVQPSWQGAGYLTTEPPRGTGTSYMSENREQNTSQVDARLSSPSGSRVEWLAGVYYFTSNFTGTFETILFPNDAMYGAAPCSLSTTLTVRSPNCYQWTRDNISKIITESAYANATIPIGERFRLIGGLNYSRDEKTYQTTPANIVGTDAGPNAAYTYGPVFNNQWNAVTYRAGLEFDLKPQAMLYGTVATGYQPGSINAMAAVGISPYTPKNESDQYTVGLKSRWLDNKLQFNVEAFQLKYKNRPLPGLYPVISGACSSTAPVAGNGTPYVPIDLSCINPNASAGAIYVPSQTSKGADFDVSYLPTAADRIDLSFEYLDAKFGSQPVLPVPITTVAQVLGYAGIANPSAAQTATATTLLNNLNALFLSYNGLILQNAPKTSGNLTYEHRFTLSGGSTFAPSVNLFYKDAFWATNNFNTSPATPITGILTKGALTRQDAYTIWNLFATWTTANGKGSVTGFVRNVQNKAVQNTVATEPGATGVNYVSLDPPRTFGVTITANF